jgi:hypothetical protein
VDWITDLSRAVGRAVGQAGSQSLDKWPSVALLVAVGGVVFGAFRTGFVRFGSDVKELLAEKDAALKGLLAEKESRIKEKNERIEELKAELAASRRALEAANGVLKQSNLTGAKATRVLEGVAVLLAKKSGQDANGTPRGE